MATNAVVRARIEEHIKEEASVVLAAMGLTVSDAFRILLTRVAREKALPFEPLTPNETTIAAIREARAGNLKTFDTFKRDYKREAKGQYRATLNLELAPVITALARDEPLEPRRRDHALTGDWKDHRDCHVKPDLVLIYRKPDDEVLQLVRLGSHSELGI
eukprot:gene17956-18191_t